MTAVELVVWGIVIHLVVDWLFQNDWIADNKANLRHPAGYVHAGAHALGMLIVFPFFAALALGVVHLLIDTRKPLEWWAGVFGQNAQGTYAAPVEIWRDQSLHVATIALAALAVGSV